MKLFWGDFEKQAVSGKAYVAALKGRLERLSQLSVGRDKRDPLSRAVTKAHNVHKGRSKALEKQMSSGKFFGGQKPSAHDIKDQRMNTAPWSKFMGLKKEAFWDGFEKQALNLASAAVAAKGALKSPMAKTVGRHAATGAVVGAGAGALGSNDGALKGAIRGAVGGAAVGGAVGAGRHLYNNRRPKIAPAPAGTPQLPYNAAKRPNAILPAEPGFRKRAMSPKLTTGVANAMRATHSDYLRQIGAVGKKVTAPVAQVSAKPAISSFTQNSLKATSAPRVTNPSARRYADIK